MIKLLSSLLVITCILLTRVFFDFLYLFYFFLTFIDLGANLGEDKLKGFELKTGLSILGRGFGKLGINDSRVSRHHLEVKIGGTPNTTALILRGLNNSLIQKKGTTEYVKMEIGKEYPLGDKDVITFLPDQSLKYFFRVFV